MSHTFPVVAVTGSFVHLCSFSFQWYFQLTHWGRWRKASGMFSSRTSSGTGLRGRSLESGFAAGKGGGFEARGIAIVYGLCDHGLSRFPARLPTAKYGKRAVLVYRFAVTGAVGAGWFLFARLPILALSQLN